MQTSSGTAFPSGSPPTPNHGVLEELAMKEKNRLGELIKTKGMLIGSYPRYTVAVKGQKVFSCLPFFKNKKKKKLNVCSP